MNRARRGAGRRPFFATVLALALLGGLAIAAAVRRSRPTAVRIPQLVAAPSASRPPGYVLGRPEAPVEIVEYADFECPGCAQFATVTEPDVRARLVNTGQVRFRLYDFQVIPQHRNSPSASLAAACAADQGRFWEMHDRLFAGQPDWNSQATEDPKPLFVGYAQSAGVDVGRWAACYDGRAHVQRLVEHQREAARVPIRSTPTLLVGDRQLEGTLSYDAVRAYVDTVRLQGQRLAPGPGLR